ncbi:hypothetical protein F4677DRAFT_432502 [Hypoxylon crocopeplum]|nr:hypothetical protein F4677DRAFT_432502 [Hypoxylon crocopeplum]
MPPFTPAQVICGRQGGGAGECSIVHLELPSDDELPKDPNGGWPDIRGFHNLQRTRDAWLNGDAIDTALAAYHRSLPKEVQDRINIVDTSVTGLFSRDEAQFNAIITGNYNRFFKSFQQTEYTLWPINWDACHWQLVVLRKESRTKDDGTEAWTHLVQMCVADSWREGEADNRRRLIENRLQTLFTTMGLTFAPHCVRDIWVPWQKDSWSCGLRVFSIAKQFLDRIVNQAVQGVEYDETLWLPMNGWFNPDMVRWEMIGLNAYSAVQAMDYKARVAVELVHNVRRGTGTIDATEAMRPPDNVVGQEIEAPPQAVLAVMRDLGRMNINPAHQQKQGETAAPLPDSDVMIIVSDDDDEDEDEDEDIPAVNSRELRSSSMIPVASRRQVTPSLSVTGGNYQSSGAARGRGGRRVSPVFPRRGAGSAGSLLDSHSPAGSRTARTRPQRTHVPTGSRPIVNQRQRPRRTQDGRSASPPRDRTPATTGTGPKSNARDYRGRIASQNNGSRIPPPAPTPAPVTNGTASNASNAPAAGSGSGARTNASNASNAPAAGSGSSARNNASSAGRLFNRNRG